MERSLFRFIWKHSKTSQLILLAVTLLTFPILYLSLELPKRIINDAIGGSGADVVVLGVTLTQIQFLMLLCIGFLLAVLANGLLKMRINTMKGVLAERMLRRFRYELLTRVTRFPRPFFRTTSQGELTAMVTSEAEPMGGLMGDLLSQPVFQAGQMLTILGFLFAQSVWFGLASISLIPLQAWLIPKLQRQINLLNKERIQEVRRLAADIGETAAGVSDIRTNGGLRHRMSLFSDRLGNLFGIRFKIFQKKFFMKFLNNFINQLTPFFFYSVGGFLAIQGEITVGALVAALAAYKDLSSPWNELLAYYNQTQDMALRWEVVTERFAPKSIVDEALFEGKADEIPSLKGDIEMTDVTVVDVDGNTVLEDINLTIPAGSRVAIQASSETAALAFADVLTREVIPMRGKIRIAGRDINELHQDVLSNRVGYAHSKPHIFQGSLGENLLMPFRCKPVLNGELPPELETWVEEAERAGNSTDPFQIDWVDPSVAGFETQEDIREWWFQLVTAMGIDDFMVHRALRSRLDPALHAELAEAVVKLRPEIAERLDEAGLGDIVYRFDPDKFNPVHPMGSNLLFSLPTRMLSQGELAQDSNFVQVLRDEGLVDELAQISANLVEGLMATFGMDGTEHPLFRRLNLDEELYLQLAEIVTKRREVGNDGLPPEDFALMLTIPFAFSAEQIGPSFSDELKAKILHIRQTKAAGMLEKMDGLFETISPDRYFPVMTLLGNAIYGRISSMAGAREKQVAEVVAKVLEEHGLRRLAAQSVFDVETTPGGENLPAVFRERIAFSRAGIKKPDVLILGNALASHDEKERDAMRQRVSELMPDATKIFIESKILSPEAYDLYVEIKDGRIDGAVHEAAPQDEDARQDLNRKLKAIVQTELFGNLDPKQQRLLAFSSQWYKAKAGQAIFKVGQEADAAYLCVKGKAGLYWPQGGDGEMLKVSEILPGRLIGDLQVIQGMDRLMDLVAEEDSVFLRIGATELLAVIENDPEVAISLLRTVAGYLTNTAGRVRSLREFAASRGVDLSELEAFEQS